MKFMFLLFVTISVHLSTIADAAIYKISYVSDDYGTLGYFTIDSVDIINNRGNNPLGGDYVLNDFIQSLQFSFKGIKWGTDDIAIGPTTAHAYQFEGDMPINPSGNGSLADNGSGQRITTYHPSVGVRFGSEYVLGKWETIAVTDPPSSGLNVKINDCDLAGGYSVSSYMATKLGNPEIHIFGVYQTNSNHSFGNNPQGKADVYVERKGVPLVIVLSSYEPVLWKIHKKEGVDVRQVILNGYNRHEIEGASGINISNQSGTGNYIVSSSYKWLAEKTQILKSEIENIYSEPITSYQGCYDASSFQISGDIVHPPPTISTNLNFMNLLLNKE